MTHSGKRSSLECYRNNATGIITVVKCFIVQAPKTFETFSLPLMPKTNKLERFPSVRICSFKKEHTLMDKTRVEMTVRDKHSSLLRYGIIYVVKAVL